MRQIFPALFGNEATKARLGRAIAESRLPHALLIDGKEGSGKLTLARQIAAALNCEHRSDQSRPLPCGGCGACRRILGGGYVDMHVLEREGGKATIGVDPIKEMRRDMFLSATEAEQKIYIIREAEKLTPEAQNALLIVLEEPPKNVVIMLLASGTDRILTTIKSRAQYIAMSRFSPAEIREYLRSTSREAARVSESDPELFEIACASADGRIGLAARLISPEERTALIEEREETIGIISAIAGKRGYGEIYTKIGELPTKRAELGASLERLITALGDLIKCKEDADAELSFFRDYAEAERVGGALSLKKLFRMYDIVSDAYDSNSKNANTPSLLALLAAKLRGA